MNQEDELPGGAPTDAVAVDSFQVQASGQEPELRNGARWCGIGIGNRLSSPRGQSSRASSFAYVRAVPYLLRLLSGDTLAAGREPSLAACDAVPS